MQQKMYSCLHRLASVEERIESFEAGKRFARKKYEK